MTIENNFKAKDKFGDLSDGINIKDFLIRAFL